MSGCSCGGGSPIDDSGLMAALRYWYARDKNGKMGTCPKDVLRHCNAFWSTDAVEVSPGATATLTFDTSGASVFFDEFAPLGLIYVVSSRGRNSALDPATGLLVQTIDDCCLDDLVQVDSVRFKGDQKMPSNKPVNLGALECCNLVWGVSCFGPIKVSGQQVETDVTNVSDPAAVPFDLSISAVMFGWEMRDGYLRCGGQAMECECPEGAVPGLNWMPHRDVSIDARFKANLGKAQVKPTGAWRPEG